MLLVRLDESEEEDDMKVVPPKVEVISEIVPQSEVVQSVDDCEMPVVLDGAQLAPPCVDEQKTPDETNAYPVPTRTAIEMIAMTSRLPILNFPPDNSKLNCPELFTLTERTQSMIL